MARTAIYKREEIVDHAFNFVIKYGMEKLSARNLAKSMGISTGPLFVAFKNFEELNNLVLERARSFYREKYYNEGAKAEIPFKGIGLKYIQFAKDYPNLFKIVFVNENSTKTTHFLPDSDETSKETLNLAEKTYGLTLEKAKKLYNHLSVYSYGLATLFANGAATFTMEDVSEMLSEMFFAIKEKL